MTHSHCTDSCSDLTILRSSSLASVEAKLSALGLPFADHFARALIGLLSRRKISLQQVAQAMPGLQDTEANRQQLRRCLNHESVTPTVWAQAIGTLLPAGKWIVALDRTECLHTLVKWKRGTTTINLLVLAVVVHGCAVPLLWTVMPSCGASDTAERKALLSRFVSLFGRERLRFLTADREFIGFEWIGWLLSQKLPFRIRIKANEFLLHENGTEKRAWEWFDVRACRCKPQTMDLWGLSVFVGGKRLATKDKKGRTQYLIVISNQKGGDLLADYRLRWKIETLFQALKGRGFDLEACRLSDEKRLSGWFGFLAIGVCWCLKVGKCLEEAAPLPLKKHGRRAVSVVQRGMQLLQQILAPLAGRPSQQGFVAALQEL